MKAVIVFLFMVIVAVVIGMVAWDAGEKHDAASCKEKYGQGYTLGHSSANSSIKWCQSPSGEVKAL